MQTIPRLVAFLLLLGCSLRGQSAAGDWSGAVTLPSEKLAVVVHLVENGDTLSGTIDIPEQGASALPLGGFTHDGTKLRFTITGVPGKPTFDGELGAATFAGKFTQNGGAFPFSLSRTTTADVMAAYDGFQAWLDESLPLLHVPGCAVAVVDHGKLLATFVSGKRDVDAAEPVTADTLFAIGSSSKAFTTWVLASLVHDGKLDWDKPVREHMPEFALEDETIAARLTPRDLVTHRSGMPRHDLVWYGATMPRAELVARLRWLPLNHDLRTDWQYNNLMFLTAGHLAERITGNTWEELVSQRILQPLGMTRSNFAVHTSQADADHAEPYRYDDKRVAHIPFRDLSTIGPAGSINSTVREMATWVALHLQHGEHAGQHLLPATAVDDLHTVRMPMGDGPGSSPDVVSVGYALGWMVDVYRGHRRVHHGGNIDGFSAMVTMLPDDGRGFVVLTNLDGTPLPELVARNLCDRALGLEIKDWRAQALQRLARAEATVAKGQENAAAERMTGTQPSHPLADFAGDYADKGYGPCRITLVDGALHVDFHGLAAPLEHWHYDVFRAQKTAQDPELADTRIQFTENFDGEVDALRVVLETSTPAIVFTRQPDAQLRDVAFLLRLAGQYEMEHEVANFAVEADHLVVTLPGQRYELTPTSHLRFELQGLSGYSVRFVLDANGESTAVRFQQPEGVFEGKRKAP